METSSTIVYVVTWQDSKLNISHVSSIFSTEEAARDYADNQPTHDNLKYEVSNWIVRIK